MTDQTKPEAAPRLRVKPLAWEEMLGGDFWAKALYGSYMVCRASGCEWVALSIPPPDDEGPNVAVGRGDFEAAQAAAEAHHTEAVMKLFDALLDEDRPEAPPEIVAGFSFPPTADALFPTVPDEEGGIEVGSNAEALARAAEVWALAQVRRATVGEAAAVFRVTPEKLAEAIGALDSPWFYVEKRPIPISERRLEFEGL